ncbi:uncharacterized protein KY384_007164 [Bacidia gigantensis]|uniref:uncharacterized protein n=1 Tax=Bacidia gigantensis TaxID=2732470 RepID=UPI001D0597B4|nr:uncharacterized protein KY384_007164 [Bacidia gigantensis]KAG8528247.1 hypothetical protein KY384_007164 [Bacidia gigantensis]
MMLIVSILIIGALSSPFVHWNETYRLETCAPTQLWSTCFLNLAYTNNTRQTITRANITAHDCSSLDGNSSTNGCPPPPANATLFTSRSYYAVLNIYNVQHHIFVWAQAINASASLPGIAAIAAQAVPTTPNSLLQSIIREFGINQAADDALVNLLDTPSIRPTPQIVNGVSGGPQHPLDAAETVPLMVNRLADVLLLAMRNFDVFLGVVKNGSYSTNDLALVGELVTVLRGTP